MTIKTFCPLKPHHSGKKYNKRSKSVSGRGCISDQVDIVQRPAEFEDKQRLGDSELDMIVCVDCGGAAVSMIESRSKLSRLRKVERRTAEEVKEAKIEEKFFLMKFFAYLGASSRERTRH